MTTEASVLEPTWAPHELEYLDRCPICGSKDRTLKFSDVEDQVCETKGTWNYYQCISCGVYYIDPRPKEETIGRVYENYFTHAPQKKRQRSSRFSKVAKGIRNDYLLWKYAYDKEPRITGGRWLMYLLPPWLRLEWDHHARHLPKPEQGYDRLLDVGCGNGKFLKDAQLAGWQCYGVDFDPLAVETAQSQGMQVNLGGLKEQKFPDEFFNAVTLSHVIEHVHQPEELLEECVRILKSGGTLWLATPNTGSIIRRWFKKNWLSLAPPQHLILFSHKSLRLLLEKTGYKVEYMRRGTHIQRHWYASQACEQNKTGLQNCCCTPFSGPQSRLRYWIFELFVWVMPSLQGDLIILVNKDGIQ